MNHPVRFPTLGVILTLRFAICIFASSLLGAEREWAVRTWQSDEGLPDNIVEGVAQAADGFLWVATRSGLARFDGVRFQVFAPMNTAGMPTSEMQGIIVDHRGRLWVAKDRGVVVCLDAGHITAYTSKDGLPSQPVLTMAEDGEGAIWVSYWNGPVFRIHEGQVRAMKPVYSETSSGYRLASDTRGQMWLGHAGVEVFRDGEFHNKIKWKQFVAKLCKAQSGGIWICTGSRLYKYNEGSDPLEVGTLPLPEDQFFNPTALYEDHAGVLWIGTTSSGLFRYDGSTITHINTSHSEILCITEDREENIWVGTRGGGLSRVRPSVLSLTKFGKDAQAQGVRSVCQDTAGMLWAVANNDELMRLEGKIWTPLSTNAGWPHIHCLSVAADPEGGVWIGTGENRLCLWRGQIIADYSKTNGLIGRTVRTLLATPSGDVWVGGRIPNTLQRLRAGKLQSFELPSESGPITAMVADAQGNFWAGTSAGLLLLVHNDELTNATPMTLAEPQPIRCLCATPDGGLWIGYGGQGVGRLKAGHFDQFSMQQGLWSDNILQIVPDGRGRIWFAGTAFIFVVNEKEFDALVEGRIPKLKSVVYGKDAGMPVMQASQGYWPGAIRSKEGRLWIPTLTGLALVNVDFLKESPEPPPVVIERVAIDGHTVAAYGSDEVRAGLGSLSTNELRLGEVHLKLPPEHRRVEVEFTALSLTAPENVVCKYRLQGVDDGWVIVGAARKAYYGHIPPGDYHFQVIACNSDGIWNETGASLSLTSEPHIWETAWFRAVATVSVIGLAVGAMLLIVRRRHRQQIERLKNQRALEQERTRIAQDLHDELGTTLTQIDLLGALANRPGIPITEALEQVVLMQTKSRDMVAAMDEIVWAVNPRNDSLVASIGYLCGFAEDFLTKASIHCRLDVADELPNFALQADVRHNLFLAFKEALNNVVRHSHATEVWLRLKWNGRSVTLAVQDNGLGFDSASDAAPGGNGLRNMMERMERIGGKCELQSQPKRGTLIQLTFFVA